MSESLSEVGKAAKDLGKEALSASLSCVEIRGGTFSIKFITGNAQVVRDLCITAVSLGALYTGYQLLKPLIEDAVQRGLGGERDDQEVRDIKPGSLHVLLHCFTNERFLEVLEDYETGRMKDRLLKEFSKNNIKIDGLKVEIENMEEVNKIKTAINKSLDYPGGEPLTVESCIIERYGSIKNLMAEARNGNVQAQADLGMAYCDGVGNLLEKDTKKAIGWLNTAIENGCSSPYVIGSLGELFDKQETPQSQQKAYELYCRAAKLGCAESQLNLAEMYRCGIDGVVNEDIREAFEWYKCAADEKPLEIGSHVHHLMTGTVKKMGILGKADATRTKITALKLLYSNYLEGDCPERRPQPTKAVYYLNKAAELGDTDAQRELGKICLNGSCEQLRDVAKARRWLGKASAKGDQKAKQLLQLSEKTDHTPDQASDVSERAFNQSLDVEIKAEKLKQKAEANLHPFAIRQPVLFTEEMLSGFQWSPTAKNYLKALKLVKKGFEILEKSRFTDGRGISYIAYGFLTENSILQAFPQLHFLSSYIFQLCDQILQKNPSFLEALVVAFALQPISQVYLEITKSMLKKLACIKNLIRFIQVAEPNGTPCEDPFEFDKNYSSWLHVLYYHIGSIYAVNHENVEAAEAFENSLKCCPSYFDSKRGLGYSLLMLHSSKSLHTQDELNKLDLSTEMMPSKRILKQRASARKESKYASYSTEKLRETVVSVLKEFLQEAPSCYKTYPNVYYYLAYLMLLENNTKEFREYYERGQDVEKKRLPFFDPVDLPIENMMAPFYHLLGNVQFPIGCGNAACTKKVKENDLKFCPCENVKYCSKDCQKADWKIHKISCSTRSKKAMSDSQVITVVEDEEQNSDTQAITVVEDKVQKNDTQVVTVGEDEVQKSDTQVVTVSEEEVPKTDTEVMTVLEGEVHRSDTQVVTVGEDEVQMSNTQGMTVLEGEVQRSDTQVMAVLEDEVQKSDTEIMADFEEDIQRQMKLYIQQSFEPKHSFQEL